MNDEIKKILERPNVYSFDDECYLYFGDYNKLKDYITNLQQRIEKAVEYINNKDIYDSEYGEFIYYDYLIHDRLMKILNGRSDE